MSDDSKHEYDVAKFIGNQHLIDIREIKNHQRNITFQFIIISLALSGLIKLENITVCHFGLKIVISIFAFIVIGFILIFQQSLSDFRNKIYQIWTQPYFQHAMNKGFLSVNKKNPERYLSFWHQFYYPLIYIFLISMVTIALWFVL